MFPWPVYRFPLSTTGLLLTLWLFACTTPSSPDQRIRALIAAGEAAIEAGSLRQIGELISPAYQDPQGHGRRELMALVSMQLMRHANIHLLVQIEHIELEYQQRAKVVLFAAMASGLADVRDLGALQADLYRFDIQVAEEDGRWLVVGAQWRPASREDFSG
ncbi:MAG: hypothetical protein KDI63_08650 [Gammaproteobacteria bacterium]|nr:hypothetical protein [Gammaproteobacteria bacterium]